MVNWLTKKDIAEAERLLKALIKSLENKPLNPRILEPSSTTKLEKNHKYNKHYEGLWQYGYIFFKEMLGGWESFF
jgi:hypothetical protein